MQRVLPALSIALVAAVAATSSITGTALADDPVPDASKGQAADTAKQPAPEHAHPTYHAVADKRLPVPLKITVVALNPDPPWAFRIENTGEHPVRVPADIRLLSFDLDPPAPTADANGKIKARPHGARVLCKAPTSMRPSKVRDERALVLAPGDAWETIFDPRLFCFGKDLDRLTEGAKVTPHFGFDRAYGKKTGPWVAQGLDNPEERKALGSIDGDAFLLPGFPPPATAAADGSAPPPKDGSGGRREGGRPPRDGHGRRDGRGPGGDGPGKDGPYQQVGGGPPITIDRNAPQLEIYVSRFHDSEAPRDVTVTVRAANEGKRDLLTLVRGRMLSFQVEALGADNVPFETTDCTGQSAPHAIPIEAVHDLGPGRETSLSVLVSEICPRTVFSHPGLYRVRPKLDATLLGEATLKNPHTGEALARASTLVRVKNAPDPFYVEPPQTSAQIAERERQRAKRGSRPKPPTR